MERRKNMSTDDKKTEQSQPRHGLSSVVKSVLWAALGVNSNKNREHDFEQGNPLAFIIGGVIFTLLFICTISLVVGFVLRDRGI